MKRHGPNLLRSNFKFIANKASSMASHVAITYKVLHLSQITCVSYAQADTFAHSISHPLRLPVVFDAAYI